MDWDQLVVTLEEFLENYTNSPTHGVSATLVVAATSFTIAWFSNDALGMVIYEYWELPSGLFLPLGAIVLAQGYVAEVKNGWRNEWSIFGAVPVLLCAFFMLGLLDLSVEFWLSLSPLPLILYLPFSAVFLFRKFAFDRVATQLSLRMKYY